MADQIVLRSADELQIMARNGALLKEVIDRIVESVRPGATTLDLDRVARTEIEKRDARPAFLGLYGFPATLCVSVNDEVVHGIPSRRVLNEGDIVSVDCGLVKDGFFSDMARTVPVGAIDEESARLIDVTERSLAAGIEKLRVGLRLGDVSAAIQALVETEGFSVVREYTGHGIGRKPHEEPKVPNYGQPGRGLRWRAGMVVCIEPMVNAGVYQTRVLEDNWTVLTADGKRSAHVEHTVAVTDDGPWILC